MSFNQLFWLGCFLCQKPPGSTRQDRAAHSRSESPQPALSLGLQSPSPKLQGSAKYQAAWPSFELLSGHYTVDIHLSTIKKNVHDEIKHSDLILHAPASHVRADILLFADVR